MGHLIKQVVALLFTILASSRSSAIPLNDTSIVPAINGTLPPIPSNQVVCLPWDKNIDQPKKSDCDTLILSLYNLPYATELRTFRRPPMQHPGDLLLPHTFDHNTCYLTLVLGGGGCSSDTATFREIALTAQVGSVQCLQPNKYGLLDHSGAKVTAGRGGRLMVMLHGKLWSDNEIDVLQPATSCSSGETSDSSVQTT